MRQILDGSAAKFLVAILGTVSSSLTEYYGTARWVPAVVMVLTAIGVYLTPNTTAPAAPPAPAVNLEEPAKM